MQTLAIIPARGGSKSIPKKNIADLAGKPLIGYVIEAIKKSGVVDRIIVSTDDRDIAEVAKKFGAEVPFMRPPELAGDSTPTIPVIEHLLLWLEKNENYLPDYILLAQATSPFMTSENIKRVFEKILENNADSGITMVAVPRVFHPFHVRIIKESGEIDFERPDDHYKHPNRQSDPKRFAHGNLWWFSREAFLREKKIEVGKRVGLEIGLLEAHDINDPIELEIAKSLIKLVESN